MVWLVVVLFLMLSAIEVSILIKKKYIKDIPLFLFLMVFALAYSISGVTDWNLSPPSALVEQAFKPLSELVFPAPGQ